MMAGELRYLSAQPERNFSQAVQAGDFLFVSGQVGQVTGGTDPGPQDFRAQADSALGRLVEAVVSAGGRPSDIVALRAFLADASYYTEYVEAKNHALGEACPSGTVVVAELLRSSLLIEVEAIAYIPPVAD